jgi:hypothetical protein
VSSFLAEGLKARAGHSTTSRADSLMKEPAINPETMTNPNTTAIMVSPNRRDDTIAAVMMIFFILLTPFPKALRLFQTAWIDGLPGGNCKGSATASERCVSGGGIER